MEEKIFFFFVHPAMCTVYFVHVFFFFFPHRTRARAVRYKCVPASFASQDTMDSNTGKTRPLANTANTAFGNGMAHTYYIAPVVAWHATVVQVKLLLIS